MDQVTGYVPAFDPTLPQLAQIMLPVPVPTMDMECAGEEAPNLSSQFYRNGRPESRTWYRWWFYCFLLQSRYQRVLQQLFEC